MEILLFILVPFCFFCWGVYSGWKAREEHAERQLNAFMNGMQNRLKEKIDEEMANLTPIVIEKHNDVFYVYNKDTNEFMAQGKTKKEVEEALHARYPDKRFACNHEILVQMGFIS